MNPWFETLGVILLSLAGVWLGRWFSRLPKSYWTLGYFIPLVLMLMMGSTRYCSVLEFIPPISWLVAGRTEFALAGFVCTMILTTPLSRVPRRAFRLLVISFMVLLTLPFSIWPFLAPVLNRDHLASLKTYMDRDDICRQNNNYTCGPAAAVTALRRLGLPAEEGQIAITAHTSMAIGTPPDLLCEALQHLYSGNNLRFEYRHFKTVSELKHGGLTLAVIKYGPLVDHWVAVLEVTDREVVVGDPLKGKAPYTHEQFRMIWRFTGIELKRE